MDIGVFTDSADGFSDEIHKSHHCGGIGVFDFEAFDGLRYVKSATIQYAVGFFDFCTGFEIEPVAAQADGVEAADKAVSFDEHIRGNVFRYAGEAADHGEFSDADELMHGDVSADVGIIVNIDVSGYKGAVCQHDVIADSAIVGDVAESHQIVVVAEAGELVGVVGAMDGCVFANGVAVADDESAGGNFVSFMLRGVPEDDPHVDFVVVADDGVAGNVGVGTDFCSGSDFYRTFDDSVGPDFYRGINFRGGVNYGSGMDEGQCEIQSFSERLHSAYCKTTEWERLGLLLLRGGMLQRPGLIRPGLLDFHV